MWDVSETRRVGSKHNKTLLTNIKVNPGTRRWAKTVNPDMGQGRQKNTKL